MMKAFVPLGAQIELRFRGQPPDPAPPAPVTQRVDRRQKAREIQESGAHRWIEAGKPIAIAVARMDGKVTAASFRKAAGALHALPPTFDNQRALGWISSMFNQLVREGALEKARHPNGAPMRVYGGRNNDQVVYRIPESAR